MGAFSCASREANLPTNRQKNTHVIRKYEQNVVQDEQAGFPFQKGE